MRNYSFDTLKTCCATLVVFLHVYTNYGKWLEPVTRCAVPCFFMISGYFLYGNDTIGRIQKGMKRNMQILCWSSLLFAVNLFWLNPPRRIPRFDILMPYTDFLFFNGNAFSSHLWYLAAYLYVLAIIYFIQRADKWKQSFHFIPLLLIGNLLLGKYSLSIWGNDLNLLYSRNFLFTGLPFFLLGAYCKYHQDRLERFFRKSRWHRILLVCIIPLAAFTSIIEQRLLTEKHLFGYGDCYLSTPILALSIFLLTIQSKQQCPNLLSRIGQKDSLYIYLFHPFVRVYCDRYCRLLPRDIYLYYHDYLAPFIIILLTIAFVWTYRWLYQIIVSRMPLKLQT